MRGLFRREENVKGLSSVPAVSVVCLLMIGSACGSPSGRSVPATPENQTSSTAPTRAASSAASSAAGKPHRPVKVVPRRPTSATDFDPARFSNPTRVTNPYLPLTPGSQLTWKGHAFDEGDRVSRSIRMTVTDMTKVVDGVRTVVARDEDSTNGELEEVELTFYAQDDDGTVWYLGEYSEEYDDQTLVKSPHWLGGLRGAKPGVMMQAAPRLGTPSYAEGWGGSDLTWTDRGKVDQVGVHECIGSRCYSDVVVIDEFNPDEPGTHQLKHYAPHVGGIRTGWRGAEEEEKEELELVSRKRLSAAEMDTLRQAVLDEEKRANHRSPHVYGKTAPMRRG
jgi:hypothetical protein